MSQPSTSTPSTPSTPYELAKAYSALPRTQKTPSGKVDNLWVLSVRKVTLEPPGLVLHLVNPDSRYVHVEKLPAAIDDADQPQRLAVPVALALMKAFVEGMMNPNTPIAPHDRPKPFAPWSMAMLDSDQQLAKLVQRQLKGLGVDKDKRTFDTTTPQHASIADQVWHDFFEKLSNAVEP
ncbi:uncharacterized protein PFL1_01749 [Pseudozyma flocculosa PF-1]|uniref:Uncharacterized protein n=1 Tax=Pseudozyma flocculosa TaxID=84751 RepID=A0A5C3EYP0_9BASI|nr:uncharacterized protein PFL1_01749 [Pseudozyma flocculosa PF-1]EPQ30852.1 hypothetical protein PFL1_01749 [Pseudozyma flocculosa PF-1]SPO36776.1 uncharacterized protein PSFLO_02247 [Pseudozyma flocculosa]